MKTVWKISTLILCLQFLGVALFCKHPLLSFKEVANALVSVSILILIIVGIVYMTAKNEIVELKANMFLSILIVSGSTVALSKIIFDHTNFDYLLAYLLFAAFILFILISDLIRIVKMSKRLDPKSSASLTILCALPLGIGVILGGIVGKLTKKF